MAASATDLLTKVGSPGTATTLSAPGHTVGGTTFTVGSTANWASTTGAIFAVDQVTLQTVNGIPNTPVRTPGTYTEWEGVVSSSTTITGAVLKYGTDQTYPAGSLTRVYVPVSSTRENQIVDWGLAHANQDGSLKTTAVQTALNLGTSALNGWNPLAYTFTYGANNGNKEFTIITASDLTSTLSAGMRFQATRGTTAPTQSMAFTAASSQYASKTSPTGISFTNTLTCEAWIYVNSYAVQDVIARRDATNGFRLILLADGRIQLDGINASNTRTVTSYQSVPLKRWVHVAAAMTMSTSTAAIYLNGLSIPSAISGTASSLVQTGDLRLGASNAPAEFFDGYISEARIWSVAQSQANVQANMAISLTGSETNLVSLFQGNGNFNDKTANANNLTAAGGAIATQASNPYNNTEYAIVTKVAYSAPNTTVTLFTGTDYNIPNMTLSSPQYSSQKVPFGFPAGGEKWLVDFISLVDQTAAPGAGIWGNVGSAQLLIPIGSWEVEYKTNLYGGTGVSGVDIETTLSTTTSTQTDQELATYSDNGGAATWAAVPVMARKKTGLTAATSMYLLTRPSANINVYNFGGRRSGTYIRAYCAHL